LRTFINLSLITALALTLSACATSHGTSPKGLEVPIEKAAVKFSSDLKEGGYKLVTTDELKKWLDQGKKVTIISALPPEEDKSFGLLPAAINAAMPKSEKDLTAAQKENLIRIAGNDKDQTIVVYCGFVACRRSHIGARILVENGFNNVFRFPAGITGWQEAGYPLTK